MGPSRCGRLTPRLRTVPALRSRRQSRPSRPRLPRRRAARATRERPSTSGATPPPNRLRHGVGAKPRQESTKSGACKTMRAGGASWRSGTSLHPRSSVSAKRELWTQSNRQIGFIARFDLRTLPDRPRCEADLGRSYRMLLEKPQPQVIAGPARCGRSSTNP
jgi:hypothetical protein